MSLSLPSLCLLARICVCFLTILLLVDSVRGEEPKVVEFKPKWKRGDSFRYEMTRTEVREEDGKVIRKVTVRTPVEVEVVVVDEEFSVLRWTQGTTVFEDPKQDTDPLARAMNTILKGLDIDLELDAEGMLVGIRNWREIRTTGHKIQAVLLSQMAKAGTPKTTIDFVRRETDKLFATKESIEAAFTRQVALLCLPYGVEYRLGKPVAYTAEIPNIFGGNDVFPAKGEATLKAINKDTGIASIAFKQTVDPKERSRILRKWLDDIAKQTGKNPPKELPEFHIDDAMEYEFDTTASWVKSVTHTSTGKIDNTTQTDTVTLARKAR